MRRIIAILAVLAVVALGCSETPTADRQEGGRLADDYADVTNVTIYRNVDDVPNVAIFCAGEERFAATLSADGTRSPELVPMGLCE